MHIITKKISSEFNQLAISHYISNDDFLIFDIETTGFSREYAIIYMIGFIYKEDSQYIYCNVFAKHPKDEPKLIKYFLNFISDFKYLISFNGDRFDIPFIKARAEKHKIPFNIENICSIDVYDLIRPLRKSLELTNLKLDTIQAYLGYKRNDTHTGGSLINVYYDYIEDLSKNKYDLLLLHNKEDVEGMIYLLPLMDLLLYINNFTENKDFRYIKTVTKEDSITIIYESTYYVCMDFKIYFGNSMLIFEKNSFNFRLLLPVENTTKKLFFNNNKDYYYLPKSDEIMHKSIAKFLPANQRTNVNKSDCYINHKNSFIPVFFNNTNIKTFQDKFKSSNIYITLESKLNTGFYTNQLIGFLKQSKNAK